ncbi:NACHT domain-containing NTPase [Streptomyces aurantiacus]|uniref:NACHT domain-containing protein n=1 Tax=Streptomyces aurantiacus TaxID=47760 RepID=UPI00131A3301|nr:NACHT domain-containing protein [Streptomyces aurantiacus]
MAVTIAVRAGTGEVDPGGLAVGLAALMLATAGLRQAERSEARQDTDSAALADGLAIGIRKREEQAHRRLLGDDIRTINVEFTFVRSPTRHTANARTHGTLEDVATCYCDLRSRRLVIAGAPGAGKTVLAVHLMLLLLKAREGGDPVPVRLSLSTFDPDRNDLDDWLTDQLTRTYRLGPAAAAALVDARLILPVLDGLDEMDAHEAPGNDSRAAAALEAMNKYLDGTTRGHLVLICRSTAYDALERAGMWAEDADRIEIADVSPAAAKAFIEARTKNRARWRPVLHELRDAPAGPLALSLSTPWRLTVALAVYDERHRGGWARDPADLLDLTLRSSEQIRDHLLELFIRAASSTGGKAAPYTQRQIRAWLTVLARYLHANTTGAGEVAGRRMSSTDLVLHELWPLTGHRRARIVHVLLTIAVWAIADLPAALLDDWKVYATNLTLLAGGSLLIGIPPWPIPSRLGRVTAGTPAGRHQLVSGLAGGLFWGGLVVAVDISDDVGPVIGLVYGLTVGLAGGAMVGVGLAGVLSDTPDVRRSHGNTSPRGVVRDDLVTGFATGLVVGLGFVPFYWFALGPVLALGAVLIYMFLFGLGGGRALALLYHRLFRCGCRGALDSLFRPWRVFGPLLRTGAGPALGAAGIRYMAFLLCARRWWSRRPLPWRLGRFLDWCCEAGLMRTAGIAYQFRHREVQEFLTRDRIQHAPPNHPTSAEAVRP